MATASSSAAKRDGQVLDSIRRLGLGVRELLKHALGGTDPNNILQRLCGRNLVRSVAKGLPDNRAYYIPAAEKAYGPQALHQRLALAWYVQVCPGDFCVPLMPAELSELFGVQAPVGAHLLQGSQGGGLRVLHVYAPETIEVAAGIERHLERARTFPKVAKAIEERSYGFLILVPWLSDLEGKLRAILGDAGDIAGIEAGFIAQARKLRGLGAQALFEVARVATPETLTTALRQKGSGT